MVIAFPVIIATIDRWASLLPLLFLYGALQSIFVSFDGHSASDPTPVSHFEYFVVFSILVACGIFSAILYRKPKMNLIARGSIVAITAFCVTASSLEALRSRQGGRLTAVGHYNDTVFVFSCVLICLLFNWSYDHFRRTVPHK
jgi:hypothetical protein